MYVDLEVLREVYDHKWQGGGLPHPHYNIGGIKDTILSLATGVTTPKSLVDLSAFAHRTDCIVVIALDSISYDLFSVVADDLDLTGCMPISSVFPTTSAVAWITIHTGLSPAEHGVYGVTFFSREFQSIYTMYHRLRSMEFKYESVPSIPTFQLLRGNSQTLMQELTNAGWQCVVLRGEPIAPDSPAIKIQEYGAEVKYLAKNSERENPVRLVNCLTTGAEKVINERQLAQKSGLFVWLFVDFDAYMHNTLDFMPGLEESWHVLKRWIRHLKQTNPGIGFVFISDHGQVEQTSRLDLYNKLEGIVQDPKLCYAHRGGAGRTVYIHPHVERVVQVQTLVQDILRDNAVVITRDEARALNLFGSHELVAEDRVGNLIAIATTPLFPAHSISAYHEHGALSWQELIVPFAWLL